MWWHVNGLRISSNDQNNLFSISFSLCVEITQAEAYDILQKCILEIQKRLIINLTNFKVAVVDKDGVRRLDDITAKTLQNYKA